MSLEGFCEGVAGSRAVTYPISMTFRETLYESVRHSASEVLFKFLSLSFNLSCMPLYYLGVAKRIHHFKL